jgi:iron complex transport system ATP-binding protein
MTVAPIEARGVDVQIDAARLLNSVSVEGGAREVVGLIGPNGAGKTTLLRVLAGLTGASGGTAHIDGQDLGRMGATEVARSVGYVPQVSPETHAFLSREIVMMGRYPHMGRFGMERAADHAAVASAMDATETTPFEDRAVYTLSGGERQRVFIARAYAQQPRVLLLDEPTANLDVRHQMRTMSLIRSTADGGISVIAAVHDLALAARYCDRLVLLIQGNVVAEGSPEEVLTPSNIESVYGVRAGVYPDPFTGSLVVSFMEPITDE